MTSRNAQGFDAEQRLVTDPPQFVMRSPAKTAMRKKILYAPFSLRPGFRSHRLSAAYATDPRLRELRVSPDAHPMQEHIRERPAALFQAMLFYTDHVAGLNHDRESNPGLRLIMPPYSPLYYHGLYHSREATAPKISPAPADTAPAAMPISPRSCTYRLKKGDSSWNVLSPPLNDGA